MQRYIDDRSPVPWNSPTAIAAAIYDTFASDPVEPRWWNMDASSNQGLAQSSGGRFHDEGEKNDAYTEQGELFFSAPRGNELLPDPAAPKAGEPVYKRVVAFLMNAHER